MLMLLNQIHCMHCFQCTRSHMDTEHTRSIQPQTQYDTQDMVLQHMVSGFLQTKPYITLL